MKTYRDLIVWQKSMALVTEIYKVTTSFPRKEEFERLYERTREVERLLSVLIKRLIEGSGKTEEAQRAEEI